VTCQLDMSHLILEVLQKVPPRLAPYLHGHSGRSCNIETIYQPILAVTDPPEEMTTPLFFMVSSVYCVLVPYCYSTHQYADMQINPSYLFNKISSKIGTSNLSKDGGSRQPA
jgi:hypothetical protein